MLRGVGRIAKLGTHNGLKSLDFLAFRGHDQVEEGLCSGCERERQSVAECAVVLSDDEIRCKEYRWNRLIKEGISGG
jgi:hypothetical protein